MRIRYIGRSRDGAQVYSGSLVPYGGDIELPDDLGASLCEQTDEWEAAKPTKSKPAGEKESTP